MWCCGEATDTCERGEVEETGRGIVAVTVLEEVMRWACGGVGCAGLGGLGAAAVGDV